MTTIAEQLAAEIAETQAAELESTETPIEAASSPNDAHEAAPKCEGDHRPAGWFATAVLACLGFAAGLGAVGLAGTTSAQLDAVVLSEAAHLFAPADATVEAIHVRQGQHVADGDALVVLRFRKTNRSQLEDQLSELMRKRELALAKVDLDVRLKSEEIDSAIHTTLLKTAELNSPDFDHQVKSWNSEEVPVSASVSYDTISTGSVLNAQAKLCDERIARLKKLKAELPDRIRRAHGIDQLDQQIEAVESAMAQPESQAIRVTGEGMVESLFAEVGSQISAGQPLLKISDPLIRYLEVAVPSERADEMKPGKRFRVEFPGGEKRQAAIGQQVESRPGTDGALIVRLNQIGELWPTLPNGTHVGVLPEDESE